MNLNFPPTYNTNVDDEDLVVSYLSYDQEDQLDELSLSSNAKKFVDENDTYHVWQKPQELVCDLGVEEVSFVDFLELTIFYQILLIWFLWSLYGEW